MTADAAALGAGGCGEIAAAARAVGDLELPRPLRLLLTAGWNLTESIGLPAAAYAIAAWLFGRDAGLVAGLAAIWLTALVRKIATGSVPSLLTISAIRTRRNGTKYTPAARIAAIPTAPCRQSLRPKKRCDTCAPRPRLGDRFDWSRGPTKPPAPLGYQSRGEVSTIT